MKQFTLPNEPQCKPLDDWRSVWIEMMGTQVRYVQGARWRHRILEAGTPDKPPLLLLHGIGAHAECWARNLVALGEHFHVVAADMVFHGYSSKNDWDPTRWVELLAEGVIDLMDALGWDDAYVQGESLGGHVTFNVGMRFPERLRRIILNTGLPRLRFPDQPPPITRGGGASNLSELSQRAITEPTFEGLRPRMEWLVSDPARMTEEMIGVRLKLYQDPEINASIRRIYGIDTEWPHITVYDAQDAAEFAPETLVLWTEHNPDKAWDEARKTAEVLPNAQYYLIPDAGHWPQWEKPELHDAILTAWFLGE
ncbi:alpha/beta fold hydrolase [Nocardia sp. NPDC052112]|uniref:alpha/beta fold hydrolase n=1 Tax=Nocardia sp. NPDC052112 TaxID=3155646 RepID=UPI00343D60B5